MSAQHTPGPLSESDRNIGADIAENFWDDRKTWPAEMQIRSLRQKARHLRELSATNERGGLGGNYRAWRYAADILDTKADAIGGVL